ncbi:transposase [Mesorhizobium sp. WSM3866]|uniref:IS66 family transposase n=1 Tax=Mesorhizobium sp. WSM3866 TaxID=422271 RepID=UPI00247828FC|nr:transposase [Mesorhizobium sp. WSM3866]
MPAWPICVARYSTFTTASRPSSARRPWPVSRRSTGSRKRYGGSRPAERLAARRRRTRPLVRALRRQLMRHAMGLSRHADIAKAFAYGTKRWRAFNRFLYDGQLEPDNLIMERAIRGFSGGRRNWLFSGSFAAAERSAVVLSIIETCKLCGVDAEAYMADVIERIQNDWPASRWDELMPWNWVRRQEMPLPSAA